MQRHRKIAAVLNYGGGGGDKVVMLARLYVFGCPRKGTGVAALGRILSMCF